MKKLKLIALILAIFALSASMTAILPNDITLVYAAKKKKEKKEKKKSVGGSAGGAAKVWNGEDFVDTNNENIAPIANEKVASGVHGVDQSVPSNYIMEGTLIKNDNAYYYQLSNGTFAELTWVNVDIDNDGLYEYLYFGPNGVLTINGTTPDGYRVNEFGAWIDNNGNVKKLEGVIANTNANVGGAGLSSTHISADRKESSNQIIDKYINEELAKQNMPSKKVLKTKLKAANYSDAEVDNFVNSIKWVDYALQYTILKVNSNTQGHIHTKKEIESQLKLAGMNDEEILGAIANCGVSDWDKYVVDYVRNIVDSSVTKDKDKLLDILYKCGLDYTEAKKALNTVYGREEFN